MPVHMSYSQTFAHAHAGRSLIGVAHGDYSTCSVCAPCTGWAHLDSRLLLARNALLDREFNSIDSFASAVTQFNLQRAVWISQECMSYLRKSHATVVEEVSSFVEHASTQDSNRTVAVWDNAASDGAIISARMEARGTPKYTHIPPLVPGFHCHIMCDAPFKLFQTPKTPLARYFREPNRMQDWFATSDGRLLLYTRAHNPLIRFSRCVRHPQYWNVWFGLN